MRKILFVDDNFSVLQGLKRMLSPMRHEWEMAFVDSVPAALDILAGRDLDIVVTDLRMPGTGGLTLLDTIKNHHPHIIRIVLSGESDQNRIMKSIRVSHQFLSKPCTPEILKSTLSRTCMVIDLMQSESVKAVVSNMESLPSLPTRYAEIMDILSSPNGCIKEVARIISGDLAMSAKIFQLVNSAFFGFTRHISSPAQAVVLLGLDTVKSLVLSIQIFTQFEFNKMPISFLERLWDHNIATGRLSKRIAESLKQEKIMIDHVFMAGLLHDVGKIVLAANFPDKYNEVLSLSQKTNLALHVSEREIFGVTHAEVGAYLMGLWGLPVPIVEALAFHHYPAQGVQQDFSPLTAVYIANVIEHQIAKPKEANGTLPLDPDCLGCLGMEDYRPIWKQILMEAGLKSEAYVS